MTVAHIQLSSHWFLLARPSCSKTALLQRFISFGTSMGLWHLHLKQRAIFTIKAWPLAPPTAWLMILSDLRALMALVERQQQVRCFRCMGHQERWKAHPSRWHCVLCLYEAIINPELQQDKRAHILNKPRRVVYKLFFNHCERAERGQHTWESFVLHLI